jgi:hypothetical protein
MSDDEYSYNYSDAGGSDNEEMAEGQDQDEFEYTDDEEEQEQQGDNFEVALENTYYNAKQLHEDACRDQDDDDGEDAGDSDAKIQEAVQEFEKAIQMEKDHLGDNKAGHFTFKCLKQIVKVRMRRNELTEAQVMYRRLLECISNPDLEGVSPNAVEKGINGMLDRVSSIFTSNSSGNGSGSGSGSGSNVGAGSSMETNNTARFIANDLDTRDGEEEKKVGSDPWSIERLEEAVQRRKERMAIQVVTSISVQGFEMNSQVLKVTDDVVIRHDENKASIVNLAAEGEIRQQFVSSGTKVHAYSDSKSKSTLNSLPTSRLPLPVALRVRSVRRCLKELDAGRPGILIKPKVNPLEGDTSLRYGHGQWWKKDSSAIHGVPRVQIKAEKYNAQSNQYALLLQVRNPTLGPIRLRLCCNVNETIEFPDSSEVILDPMTLQKATVNIMSPTQQTDQGMNMEYISLEPVEDSFLDIGKEATTEFDIDGWVQTEDLDWSLESSFRLLSFVSDVVCIQYITGSVQTREGLDENQNEECVYLGTPLSLEIEIGEESWESSLIQARVMEGEGKDLISFPILPVWRDRSYL